jgi:hypothetical protein
VQPLWPTVSPVWRPWLYSKLKTKSTVGRTPACVTTCNSQDTMSAAWRKERNTLETNEIMKTAAHRSESWCWRQLHAANTCSKTRHGPFLCVKTQTSVLKEQHQCTLSMSEKWRHVINYRRCDKTQTRATSVCGLESESRMKKDCVFRLMSWCLSWRSWGAAALRLVPLIRQT